MKCLLPVAELVVFADRLAVLLFLAGFLVVYPVLAVHRYSVGFPDSAGPDLVGFLLFGPGSPGLVVVDLFDLDFAGSRFADPDSVGFDPDFVVAVAEGEEHLRQAGR